MLSLKRLISLPLNVDWTFSDLLSNSRIWPKWLWPLRVGRSLKAYSVCSLLSLRSLSLTKQPPCQEDAQAFTWGDLCGQEFRRPASRDPVNHFACGPCHSSLQRSLPRDPEPEPAPSATPTFPTLKPALRWQCYCLKLLSLGVIH